jgi:DNA-directed RNA polymerase specialized sigma24 family protein
MVPRPAIPPHLSDRDLLHAIAVGDRAALRELRLRYRPTAYAVAYSVVVDPEQAEAAVSNAFTIASSRAAQAQVHGTSVARWICQLVREAAAGFRRPA